jgi:hypothetical protein
MVKIRIKGPIPEVVPEPPTEKQIAYMVWMHLTMLEGMLEENFSKDRMSNALHRMYRIFVQENRYVETTHFERQAEICRMLGELMDELGMEVVS